MGTEARGPDAPGSGQDQPDGSKKDKNIYCSTPEPPEELWDTDDRQFLEKVTCKAIVRLISVDPKDGSYEARMKCRWRFRTQNSRDRTEVQLRVPGIRMPGLLVTVNESRIWRDLKKSTEQTIYWHGTSLFTIKGFEIFEVRDFPFDRQIVNFELFDFVWRPDKDAATYDFSMRMVRFEVETVSMLPEWSTYSAIVIPENEATLSRGPTNTSRFRVVLRIERKEWYYVVQVFLVTYMITSVACLPLAMPPTEKFIGNRLGLYGSGLLTLMAFKFTIAAHLPRVQYSTFTDNYMLWQIVTIIGLAFETLIAPKIVGDNKNFKKKEFVVDMVELVLLCILLIVWLVYFLRATIYKKRADWNYVLTHQDSSGELSDAE